MDSSDLECGICSNVFSDDHCPKILPCSHTFCGSCIDGIISTQRKNCPICRERFTATASQDLMLNRIALNMAKQFSSMHLEAQTTSKSPKTPSRGATRFLQVSINDFKKETIKTALGDSEATESKITGVLGLLEEMIEGILKVDRDIYRVMRKLQKVKPLIKRHLTQIRREVKKWQGNLSLVKGEKEKILDYEIKLQNSGDYSSTGMIMEEAAEALQGSREKFSEFNLLLQNNEKQRQQLEKEFLDAEVELRKVLEEAAQIFKASPQNDVMGKTLQCFSCAARASAGGNEQRETFVVKKIQGRLRLARVKKGPNNQLLVSHLVEGSLPRNCTTIQVDSLMDKSCRRTYLDLSVDDTHLGRIIIKVIDEGNLALNFLHLCAGDLGPSYANARVSAVRNKGGDGEYICMGDYAVKGGTSNEVVLSGVDWRREGERETYEEKSLKEGQVRGNFYAHFASWFYIVTRDDPSRRDRRCFGMVEEGLDVLRDAISRYRDIKRVKINDCGLIFSL